MSNVEQTKQNHDYLNGKFMKFPFGTNLYFHRFEKVENKWFVSKLYVEDKFLWLFPYKREIWAGHKRDLSLLGKTVLRGQSVMLIEQKALREYESKGMYD